MSYIRTFTGRAFMPIEPIAEDVDIRDIAHALSLICRFTGHVKRFYSVAEHSLHVSLVCEPKDALWGLLHDASEAYIADVSSPVKHDPAMARYREIEAALMSAVCARFGLPDDMPASVADADRRLLHTEMQELMPQPETVVNHGLVYHWSDVPALGLDPVSVERAFIERFRALSGVCV